MPPSSKDAPRIDSSLCSLLKLLFKAAHTCLQHRPHCKMLAHTSLHDVLALWSSHHEALPPSLARC